METNTQYEYNYKGFSQEELLMKLKYQKEEEENLMRGVEKIKTGIDYANVHLESLINKVKRIDVSLENLKVRKKAVEKALASSRN